MITKKHITYALIALAAIGIIALLWFGLHQIAAAIALLFGGGGAKALQHYARADIEGGERNATIEQQAQADQARAEWEAKADLAAAQAKDEQRRQGLLDLAAREAQAAKERVNGASTQADLQAIEDKEYQALNSMLPPDKREDGYIRATVCAALILITLCMMAISGSVGASPATPTDKAKTLERIKILQRARHEIQRLRDRIEFVSREYEIKIKALKANHSIALRRVEQLRESDNKTCRQKIGALNMRTCPPCWPHGLVAAGAVAVVCGVGFGIREITRP